MENRRRRVPAMAPEERRAALIRATIPLLHEHGIDVSTRQIAAAAGVAEGTIFGVFENKNKLVTLSALQALDPQPTIDALAAIDRHQPLRERMVCVTRLVHRRFTENAGLLSQVRKLIVAAETRDDAWSRMADGRRRFQDAIADVFTPDAAQLRRSPASVARLLLLLCSAQSFGPFGDPDGFDADETVSLLLDGLLTTHDHTDTRGAQSTC